MEVEVQGSGGQRGLSQSLTPAGWSFGAWGGAGPGQVVCFFS